MKDLKPIRGRSYILDLINQGEHQTQDFKYAISDARKIARSISAFANRDGGHLLVGVKDNGAIAGVRNEEDIFVIEQAAQMYCDPPQTVEFTAFNTGESGVVIRARVARSEVRPVRAQEPDKTWRAYYRVADENIHAHPLMVRAWIARSSDADSVYSDGGAETEILRLLGSGQPVEIGAAQLATRRPRRVAEEAIVRLAASGIITFEYVDGRFVLAMSPDA